MFWNIIYSLAFLLFVFAISELRAFLKFPKGHPNRGLYLFNIIFLTILILGVLFGGRYFEARRTILQSMIVEYPYAEYMPERGGLRAPDPWVYTTDDTALSVVEFYRDVAHRSNDIFHLDDTGSDVRVLISSSSTNIFLTIKEEKGKRVLYYSKEGSVRVETQ